MKSIKKMFAVLLSFVLLMGCMTVSEAAENTFTYRLTLYSGEKGDFASGDMIVLDVPMNAKVSLADYSVELPSDSKYFFQGFKVSGTEKLEYVVTMDRDRDYVANYEIKGDLVEYTIQYLDENGERLAPDTKAMGNVGDKPVVAGQYFEGWQPNANALTKTLSSDPSKNIFPFHYRRLNTVITVPGAGNGGNRFTSTDGGYTETEIQYEYINGGTTTETEVAEGGTTTAAGAGAGDGTGADGTGTGTGAGGAGADAGNAGATTDAADDQVPLEVLDLDDEAVPQANLNLGGGLPSVTTMNYALIGTVAASLLGALAAIALILSKRRKEEEETEEQE